MTSNNSFNRSTFNNKTNDQMRNIVFIMMLIAILPASVKAQCNPNAEPKNLCLTFEPNIGASFSDNGISMKYLALDLNFGLKKRLNVIVSLDQTYNNYKIDDVKAYFANTGLAGGLSYKIIKKGNGFWGVKAKMGSTIGNVDWKNTFYDVSTNFAPNSGHKSSYLSLGIGYRYVHSREDGIGHHNFVYFSLGFGL